MQQVHTLRIGIGDRSRVSPWSADESEPAIAPMRAAWERRGGSRAGTGALFSKLVRGRGREA